MKKKYLLSLAIMAMGSTLLTGCLGDDNIDNSVDIPLTEYIVTKGALIINNGSIYNSIDGSLTFLDLSKNPISVQQSVYKMANGMSLGGSPNDVIVYGSKIYIVGSDENTIFVLRKTDFRQITTISTTEEMGEAEGHTPRRLAAYGNKVYVSTYGGYVGVIDTLSLSIRDKYKVGSAPEGMAFGGTSDADVSLYVANSDYGYGDGSISKINLANGSVTEIKNASIRYPQEIVVWEDVLYVLDWGYYDMYEKEAGVYMIHGNIVSKIIPDATGMAASGNCIVTYNYSYESSKVTYYIYNVVYGTLNTFNLSGGKPIESPCAINIDPNTGYVYIASRSMDPETGYPSYTTDGFVNIYNGKGEFIGESSYATGVEPHAIAFCYGTAKF